MLLSQLYTLLLYKCISSILLLVVVGAHSSLSGGQSSAEGVSKHAASMARDASNVAVSVLVIQVCHINGDGVIVVADPAEGGAGKRSNSTEGGVVGAAATIKY